MQVWPIDVNLKFLEPVGRELQLLGKVKLYALFMSVLKGGKIVEMNQLKIAYAIDFLLYIRNYALIVIIYVFFFAFPRDECYFSNAVHGQRCQPYEQIVYRSLALWFCQQNRLPTVLVSDFCFVLLFLFLAIDRTLTRKNGYIKKKSLFQLLLMLSLRPIILLFWLYMFHSIFLVTYES